ncbi:MAG: hypothetical protein HY740_08005 [Chloroflexi bacterium]|nr:hypothetical protein [Chloroflexota bacterium]
MNLQKSWDGWITRWDDYKEKMAMGQGGELLSDVAAARSANCRRNGSGDDP